MLNRIYAALAALFIAGVFVAVGVLIGLALASKYPPCAHKENAHDRAKAVGTYLYRA
jgi:hypothetical protein